MNSAKGVREDKIFVGNDEAHERKEYFCSLSHIGTPSLGRRFDVC